MVRLLGLRSFSLDPSPREITRTRPVAGQGSDGGENGWLIRFFDSAFFSEWIAVSYLYKHDHDGVRDYLCNRMYTLPLAGIESYLFQICYMLVHKPSPSLDKFVIDTCSKALRIALKVHWFLMAELEDSDDNEGISQIQEKCQIAATLMGEWSPLVRPPPPPPSTPSSPRSNPVLNRLLSSKQKLLSLASSPTLGSSPLVEESSQGNSSNDSYSKTLTSSEENKLLKKLIPGPKVRDALFFRKSLDKDEEEQEKDGFLKRLRRDSKDKEDDADKEGFFRRLLRESKDDEGDLTASSDSFLKRLFRDKEEKVVEDDEKEGFLRRIFKDKGEEKKDGGCDKNEGDDKASENTELDEKENLFRRIFKEKHEERRDSGCEKNEEKEKAKGNVQEEDKEGFFRRIFKDKNDEKKESVHDRDEERGKVIKGCEDDDKDNFFRRFFKEKNEEKKGGWRNKNEEEDRSKKSAEDDNIFRKLFKDKSEEKKAVGHDKHDDDKGNGRMEEREREGFFRRIFKEKHEDKQDEGHDKNKEDNKGSETFEEAESSEILSFRRLFQVHPEEPKTSSSNENGDFENSPGAENFFRRLFRDRDKSIEDSELLGAKVQKEKHLSSSRQLNEKAHGKPPLPNNVISEIRKSSYHASLEFVQSLCETSYGLVDIYPIEDRKIALRESLTEINSHIADAQKSGGMCFPMGKGMYRVINIPEDEAVLLNSREKAPYLICIEVMKCETPSRTKATSDAQKLSRGGIPLADRDAQLPKPPPWAYPMWSQNDTLHYDADGMLKSTSQAIDQAMARLWEAKVKYVNVSFSIERKSVDHKKNSEEFDSGRKIHQATGNDDLAGRSATISDQIPEWITINLSAVPGVNMDDIEEQDTSAPKDHRRVPSTVAVEEAKVGLLPLQRDRLPHFL